MDIKVDVNYIGEYTAIDANNYDVNCDQDGYFSRSPVGYGKTEADAIQDLMEQIEEKEEIRQGLRTPDGDWIDQPEEDAEDDDEAIKASRDEAISYGYKKATVEQITKDAYFSGLYTVRQNGKFIGQMTASEWLKVFKEALEDFKNKS